MTTTKATKAGRAEAAAAIARGVPPAVLVEPAYTAEQRAFLLAWADALRHLDAAREAAARLRRLADALPAGGWEAVTGPRGDGKRLLLDTLKGMNWALPVLLDDMRMYADTAVSVMGGVGAPGGYGADGDASIRQQIAAITGTDADAA